MCTYMSTVTCLICPMLARGRSLSLGCLPSSSLACVLVVDTFVAWSSASFSGSWPGPPDAWCDSAEHSLCLRASPYSSHLLCSCDRKRQQPYHCECPKGCYMFPLPPAPLQQGPGSEAGIVQGSGSLRGNDDPEALTVTQKNHVEDQRLCC